LLSCCMLLSRVYASLGATEFGEYPLRNALLVLETKPVNVIIPTHLGRSVYAAMAFIDPSEEWPCKAVRMRVYLLEA